MVARHQLNFPVFRLFVCELCTAYHLIARLVILVIMHFLRNETCKTGH